MELRDFAEQVLFATTLEEKLRAPTLITDEHPGSPLIAPLAPGRPAELRFKPTGAGKAEFPGVHRLDQAPVRGRLLHFFANHELLATELMALALLRFPDAPAPFRRGVLQTLKDEQLHTRLYVQRMRDCGVQFGELPVSGYFWRSVAPMQSPLDYVAGLCLTFEQANLDYCRYFAHGFQAAGDLETAGLLDRIYRDEIGHVASGLKWFRRWKQPGESDWEAFCRQLKFPLSPQRAKGLMLNVEGRRAAGLDSSFIAELNVYSQSKGRTPSVFVFNPFAEAYIAQGKSFTPVKHQQQLAADLANLPQFLCRSDDIVLLEKRPSVEFLSTVKQAGFPLPEFVEFKAGRVDSTGPLSRRKLGRLRPWAWAPDSLELLTPLLGLVTGETRTASQRFNERIACLYSKAWSADFLGTVLAQHRRGLEVRPPGPTHPTSREPSRADSWLCTEDEAGIVVGSMEGALSAIAAIRQRGHHRIVAKEVLGLAGHNALRLWEPELLTTHQRWLDRALQGGRKLVIEPWLERELDFSIQLEMEKSGLKLCGYTGLINDRKGQFQANWAAAGYDRRLPPTVSSLFLQSTGSSNRLQRLYTDIFSLLESELRRVDFIGPIGIDAFVYRTSQGDCRLKPIVEVNPRYTMGRLTLELMKHTCPGSHALFRLVSLAQVRAEGFADFASYARALIENSPLLLKGEPVPKLQSGALCLNDPTLAQACLATFQVGRTLPEIGVSASGDSLASG